MSTEYCNPPAPKVPERGVTKTCRRREDLLMIVRDHLALAAGGAFFGQRLL